MNFEYFSIGPFLKIGHASQISAERAGYRCHVALEYDELHEIQPGLSFDGIGQKSFKVFSYQTQ